MNLTAQALREKLLALSIPVWGWQLADDDFGTVSREWVRAVWEAWIESLRLNAPELLEQRQLGGGKSVRVPKWIKGAGDCENHGLVMFAHAITGNWLHAVQGGPLAGRAFGIFFYTAQARAENRNRAGRHCAIWFVDHEGSFRTFEPGDGDFFDPLPLELNSANFGLAA